MLKAETNEEGETIMEKMFKSPVWMTHPKSSEGALFSRKVDVDVKVGSVPLPVYVVLSAVIFVTRGMAQQLPVNMLGGFAMF